MFVFFISQRKWRGAQAYCRSYGMDLVSIESGLEDQLILDELIYPSNGKSAVGTSRAVSFQYVLFFFLFLFFCRTFLDVGFGPRSPRPVDVDGDRRGLCVHELVARRAEQQKRRPAPRRRQQSRRPQVGRPARALPLQLCVRSCESLERNVVIDWNIRAEAVLERLESS